MDTVITILIAAHLVAVEILAGTLLFLYVVVKPARIGLPELTLTRRVERIGFVALGVAAVTMIGWLWLITAAMAGLRTLPTPSMVLTAITSTPFGMVWGLRALALSFTVSAFVRSHDHRSGRSAAPLAWALVLLVSLTLSSRVATGDQPYLLSSLHALHLLGTAAWVGGVFSLVFIAWRAGDEDRAQWRKLITAGGMTSRYRRYFLGAAAGLVLSGAGMGWVMTGGRIIPQFYFDKVLVIKAALAAAVLVVGGLNRSVLAARLFAGKPHSAAPFWAGITVEVALVIAAISAAAVLEMTPIPIFASQ